MTGGGHSLQPSPSFDCDPVTKSISTIWNFITLVWSASVHAQDIEPTSFKRIRVNGFGLDSESMLGRAKEQTELHTTLLMPLPLPRSNKIPHCYFHQIVYLFAEQNTSSLLQQNYLFVRYALV